MDLAKGIVKHVKDKTIKEVDSRVMPFGLKLGDFSGYLETTGPDTERSVGDIVVEQRRKGETFEIRLPPWLSGYESDESSVSGLVVDGMGELSRSFVDPVEFETHYAKAVTLFMNGSLETDGLPERIYGDMDPLLKYRFFNMMLEDTQFVERFRQWKSRRANGYEYMQPSTQVAAKQEPLEESLLRVVDSVITIAVGVFAAVLQLFYPVAHGVWHEVSGFNSKYEISSRLTRFWVGVLLIVLERIIEAFQLRTADSYLPRLGRVGEYYKSRY